MQQQLNKPYLWSHSQIGASHIRKEKPNQDSVGILSLANDSVHILAVSDGHVASVIVAVTSAQSWQLKQLVTSVSSFLTLYRL